ncbi:sensor domain-containing diguanylate cyclase [Herbaspirillum rhizosphaerae]|uniref:sensor domain-containing diguanylate cyclase n=1 Tax=Herbaspirillum rhizosphaerae TaxID=346179 RepID=UPI00067E5AB1|nr:diguanylate cyclase [Herbaspirillum rhizosphaerae]
MNNTSRAWERPRWWFYLLLPLVHFASVKLTFFCAVTPENEVVVWLPNAVLLAALMRFRGQRAWLMAALAFCSDTGANLAVFTPAVAVQLSGINLIEVLITYLLMRRTGGVSDLKRVEDLRKFTVAGPLIGTLIASLMAAAVLKSQIATDTPYLTLTRLWWFGDALGMMIYTPLLLALTQSGRDIVRLRKADGLAVLLIIVLAGAIFSTYEGAIDGISLTPTLLLPMVLYIAVRFGTRWTTLTVALISLAISMMLTGGQKPFGNVSVHMEIVRAQEFILTLCLVGIGFSILINELRVRERSLEERVRQRTRELEESNSKLATLSQTDGLTGIANRRRFDEVLAAEWSRAGRSVQPLALAILDVDYFKAYNDSYGHQAGDDCLRAVAALLNDKVRRTSDLAARYGGEEFAFVAPMTDRDSAYQIAEAVRNALEQLALPHIASPFRIVTASIGVAVVVPGQAATPQSLFQLADAALYQAKQQGRNRVVIADDA